MRKKLYPLMIILAIQAADTPQRICRSPELQDLRKLNIYSKAAQVLGTTYEVMERVAMHKVENYDHIVNLVDCIDRERFECSRKILSYEVLSIANEKLRFWLDFCERSIESNYMLREKYARE